MQQTEWQPKTAAITVAGIAGILLAVGAVTLVTDVPGQILVGTAAGGLLVFALMSWRARPKLAITQDGLRYRGWWQVRQLTKADIKRIRITEFRRIGRKVRLLEIDTTDDRLIVLSRWDLGGEPLHVLDALTDAGYAPGAGSGGDY
ncbi:PH domain-containing protein [Mycobacterium sp. 236(2023)]|uniref:PH domain-containing protein n=1 Tax=Mycobacterium sp. 236(2023) TaxID=3038163 RepID=UPI0024150CA3|nr:PH domain-containing protein [Mycobacterium sp. 236(2023)]MDG4667345.1 PH domain-containing protein [Mycobacterium sp. 236(2023)]